MNNTFKIFKYSFIDLLRSKWTILYIVFFLFTSFSLLYFSSDLPKAIVSLMNVVVVLVPLISTMLGVIYYYNIQEFISLLLSQPVKRSSVFMGQFLGLVCSLVLAIIIGMGIPFLIYGIHISDEVWNFGTLIFVGILLSFIFSGIAFLIGASNSNKIKGFGFAIVFWLFMAVLYDGLFLLILILFHEYPLEKTSIVISIFNPIDLSRTLMMLKLDIAALLGYTGAVFNKLFGTGKGMVLASSALIIWAVLPILMIIKITRKKDF